MTLSIVNNDAARIALTNIGTTAFRVAESAGKLASGTRVVDAGDDVAAMAQGTRVRAERMALGQAALNVGQARAMLDLTDQALARQTDIVTRMKQLSIQAGSDNLGDFERGLLDLEFQDLLAEIDRIANDTTFGTTHLLNRDMTPETFETNPGIFSDENANGFINLTIRGVDNSTVSDGGEGRIRAFVRFLVNPTGFFGNYQWNINLIFNDKGVQERLILRHFMDAGTSPIANQIIDDGMGGVELNGPVVVDIKPEDINSTLVEYEVGGVMTTVDQTTFTDYTLENVSVSILLSQDFDLNVGNTVGNDFRAATNYTDYETDFQRNLVSAGSGILPTADRIDALLEGATTRYLGLANLDILTTTNANTAGAGLDFALNSIVELRAKHGAASSQLSSAARNLATVVENFESARSVLMDLDVAREMARFTAGQILLQSGIAALAQSNIQQANILNLLV